MGYRKTSGEWYCELLKVALARRRAVAGCWRYAYWGFDLVKTSSLTVDRFVQVVALSSLCVMPCHLSAAFS